MTWCTERILAATSGSSGTSAQSVPFQNERPPVVAARHEPAASQATLRMARSLPGAYRTFQFQVADDRRATWPVWCRRDDGPKSPADWGRSRASGAVPKAIAASIALQALGWAFSSEQSPAQSRMLRRGRARASSRILITLSATKSSSPVRIEKVVAARLKTSDAAPIVFSSMTICSGEAYPGVPIDPCTNVWRSPTGRATPKSEILNASSGGWPHVSTLFGLMSR